MKLRPPGRRQGQAHGALRQPSPLLASVTPITGNRLSGDAIDFQRPYQPLPVVRMQTSGRLRIHGLKLAIERVPSFGVKAALQLASHSLIRLRHGRHPLAQHVVIQHGAAHQNGHPALAADALNQCTRIGRKFSGRVGFGGVADINEVVGRPPQRGRIRLGGTNVHAPVHQGRIDADQLAVESLPQLDGQVRLA